MHDRSNSELDVFAQLKPLYGERVDQWWIAFQQETPRGKADMLQYLTMLAIRVQHKRIGDRKIYLEPPKQHVITGGEYTIGNVVFPGMPSYDFTLYRNELLRHLLVVGPTGTGKTTLFFGILRQLLNDGTVFWCVDWKRNYRALTASDQGKDIVVVTLGSDLAPLRLNILQPPKGITAAEWVEQLSDAISAGYLLMQGARNPLKKALRAALRAHGTRATLRDALTELEFMMTRSRSREYGWMESSHRSLEELTTGPFGDALNDPDYPMTIDELLNHSVVFELEGLGMDQKKTFCVYLLQAVLLTRKRQNAQREVLRHVMLFDEGHHVFPKERRDEPSSVQTQLVREVRELGTAVIVGTQQTDISDSIIANCGNKIFLRMDFTWDVRLVSDMLSIEPWVLTKIPDGQGIARIAKRWHQPFLFSFPEQPLKNVMVSDDSVREQYLLWRAGTPNATPVPARRNEILGTKALTLLHDIAKHPLSTTTQRYERLGWNPKIGNGIKDTIIHHRLSEVATIEAGRSRIKVLTLTMTGTRIVTAHGGIIQAVGPGSIEHEYWRYTIKALCEKSGYTVTLEHQVPKGRVDVCAKRAERTILIEVETGKSTVLDNVHKCLGHGELIVFFTTSKAHDAIREHLPSSLITLTPETINELTTIIQ